MLHLVIDLVNYKVTLTSYAQRRGSVLELSGTFPHYPILPFPAVSPIIILLTSSRSTLCVLNTYQSCLCTVAAESRRTSERFMCFCVLCDTRPLDISQPFTSYIKYILSFGMNSSIEIMHGKFASVQNDFKAICPTKKFLFFTLMLLSMPKFTLQHKQRVLIIVILLFLYNSKLLHI